MVKNKKSWELAKSIVTSALPPSYVAPNKRFHIAQFHRWSLRFPEGSAFVIKCLKGVEVTLVFSLHMGLWGLEFPPFSFFVRKLTAFCPTNKNNIIQKVFASRVALSLASTINAVTIVCENYICWNQFFSNPIGKVSTFMPIN